jgi:hypothetical protein
VDGINFCDLFNLQKHDIIKKRLDSHGNAIESRQEGIGAPKVSDAVSLEVHLLILNFFKLNFTFGHLISNAGFFTTIVCLE